MVSFRAQLNSGSPCSNRLDFTPAVLSYIYIYIISCIVVKTCVVLVVLLLCMCC